MKAVARRPLHADEIGVIRSALQRAGVGPSAPGMLSDLEALRVVAECECGCRSLYFRQPAAADYRVADGVGYLRDGERVDLLVWASSNRSAAFEIVDHAGRGELPPAESVCSWEKAGNREAKK